MKKIICLAAGLLALTLMPGFGQPLGQPIVIPMGQQIDPATGLPISQKPLTKFNLDFPGGTPKDLVTSIEKATGKPLNVIIPDEDADTKLPPLKMETVDISQLFTAVGAASQKQESRVTSRNNFGGAFGGSGSYTTVYIGYGFKTDGNPTDNSIWYFYVQNPPQPPDFSPPTPAPVKVCRYYPLAAYLNNGLTVDDITTAIQTGWKMEGANPLPELNYHKETKLLIAYGEPDKLQAIDDVLAALQQITQNPAVHFGQHLNNIINKIPQPAAGSRQFGGNSPLTPEAQAILIEKNRLTGSGSTNLSTPLPSLSPLTPLSPELQNPPADNSNQ